MKKIIIYLAFFFIVPNIIYSANEHFRSIATGDWNSTSTWEMSTNNGSTWIPATATPSDTSGPITVRNPDVVTVTADVTANQLTINTSAVLTINNGILLTILPDAGYDLYLLANSTLNGPGKVRTQGTVELNLRGSSAFNAALNVNTGTTTATDYSSPVIGRLYGSVTIDNGATLSVQNGGYFLEVYGDLINNGTISGVGSTFKLKGASFNNSGNVDVTTLSFDSTSSLSGNGSFTSSYVNITLAGNVSLNNNISFSPLNTFSVKTGGTLSPNNNILTFNSGTFEILSGGTVSNSGTFKTEDTVSLNLRNGSSFNAPVVVSNGITYATDYSSPVIGRLYGSVTIDNGATLSVQNGGYFLEVYGDLINNGTISGVGSTFKLKGASFNNSGNVNVYIFSFDSTSTVSGSGSFTGNVINVTSLGNVSLMSNVTFSPLNIFSVKTAGTLSPNNNILTFNSGTFEILSGGTVSNSGTFKTEDTVSLNLRNGSSFNAPVVVSNGITTATDLYSPIIGRLYGSVTIDNGATLFVQNGGYFLEVYGDLINNGTISGIGSTFIFKGSSFNNSGNVNVNVLSFDSTLNLSGIGNFTGNNVYIGSSGNVTLTSENDFSVNNLFSIKNGGVLNLNNNILKFTSGTFEVLNGSTVNNSGSFQTENNVTLNLRDGSNFAAPLKVLNGITSATDNSSPITGKLYGPVTIDSGATLSVRNGGYTLNFYDDLTNNGSLTGSGSTLRFFGPVFTNNGNVSPTNFFFETGAHTLQGTGDWSVNANILTGSVTTLGSDHQMHSVLINAGGTFDITSYTLKLSQNGTPLINNGIFTTTMSTVEYNGVAGQLVAITNVEYYSLTINNPAHVNIFAPKTIPGTLSILDGVFTNGANITMGDGAAIVRRDGSLSAVPTFGVSVDVFYIGTNPTASSVELPAATSVLRDLTINNSGGVNLTDSRTVNRTLYLTNGTFTNGAYLTLFNGVIIDRAEGVLNSVPSFPVTVNVVYSGNSTISTGAELPVSTTVLQKLEVNKSGSVLLSSDITVNDTMKVILGSFNLNGFIITMGPAAYLTETPGNTVMGSAGYLVANRDLNAPTALNVAGLGAIFTTSQNMGMTEVIRGHTIQVEDTLESMERYYDISPANNSGLNATFVFKYDDSELNGFNPNNLVLFKSTNNGVNWFYEPSSNNPFAKEITSVGVNSFSKWTAGDATNSLPVELASFSSNVNGRNVSLNWSTSSEINNSGFEIERSLVSNSGNSTWKKIGYREGNGNSTSGNSYSFSDNNLNTGMYSYRLKQIDFNGSFEYHNLSNDVEIGVPTEFNLSQNYPNPFNPSTKIDFQIPENGNVKITLYDMTGREVAVILNEVKEAGYYNVNFNGSNLSTGAYFYRINANDFTATKKMTLIK